MAKTNQFSKLDYYEKAVKWLIGNIFWALLPLWFMSFMKAVSGGKVGGEEIYHLVVHDGVILFVCCAIMGVALVELILTGKRLKIMTAYRFAIIPCFISLLILTDYSLIIARFIDYECFNLKSKTSVIVILLTIIYCTFVKAEVYIKEDTPYE